jgi:hypothetical protein
VSIGLKKLLPAVSFLSVFGLSACSGPEGEQPVSLREGLYTFKTDGLIGKGPAITEICITGSDDAAKIDTLITEVFALTEDCSHQPEARVGNAISGNLTCEIDESTGVKTAYNGSLTAESLAIDATIQSYAPGEKTSADGRFLAKRNGDCS